jgi:hypothetical protein
MSEAQWTPGHLLELSGSYWKTCALHAAVKLDLFTAIADADLSSQTVADKLECEHRGILRLLNAVTALGLMIKIGGHYRNTAAARKFLCKDSRAYLGHMIMHHHHLMDSWSRLDETVRTGKPVRKRASTSDAQWRESFLMGMFNMAMNLAPTLAALVDLHGCSRLLDLGGGPGTYAIHFCQKYPQLQAVVFDLPTTRPFAEKTIADFGLSDRIVFKPGNYLEDEIPNGFDAGWLSHILHGEGPEHCYRIVRRAAGALNPGGLLMIHEFILDDSMDSPLFPALFSLNMLLGTPEGQAYSESQLKDMMSQAGVQDVERIQFESPNDSGLLKGRMK